MEDFLQLTAKDIATLLDAMNAWALSPILDHHLEIARKATRIEDREEQDKFMLKAARTFPAVLEECGKRSEFATIMKAKLVVLKQQMQTAEELNNIVGGVLKKNGKTNEED